MPQAYLPLRLTRNLSIQHVGDETLVYDEARHQAYCLNRIASAVWKRCDGQHSIAQIVEGAGAELGMVLPEESLHVALARFEADGLLEARTEMPGEMPLALLANHSRRSLIAKLGASAVLMIPAVAVIMAPKAAQAYNGCVNCSITPPTTGNQTPGSSFAGPSQPQQPASNRPQLYNDDLQ